MMRCLTALISLSILCYLSPTVIGDDESQITVYDVTKRSDSETHPELLAFRLELPEDNVILHLQRRDSLNVHEAPVFVTGDDGQLKRLERGAPDVRVYQSLDKRAAVTVTAKRLSNGRIERSLMGYFDVNADGTVNEIKRSEETDSIDRKRDVSGGVVHIVTRRQLKLESLGKDISKKIEVFRRQKNPTYYIETFVLIDFSTFNMFQKDMGKTIEHYSQVMNGIDLIFRTIKDPALQVRVMVTGFFVAQSAKQAPWTDTNPAVRSNKKANDVIKPGEVKALVKPWLEKRANQLPPYDHVQLYSGIPFRSEQDDGSVKASAGVSGNICEGRNSASLVRAAPNEIIRTGPAHEIGHSMGAPHDINVGCPKNVGSVMGGGPPYTFSKCAINAMKTKMAKLNEKKENCLLKKGVNDKKYASIIKKLPGQFFNVDVQCKMLYGTESSHCTLDEKRFNMCDRLTCMNEKGKCEEYKNPPAYGTSCGKGKLCIQGKCVGK